MRMIPLLVVAAPLVVTSAVLAGPVRLTDQEMGRVAAGSTDYGQDTAGASGGAIVGNSSTANLTTSGSVAVSDGAQEGGRAVNLVNSVESGVANGVNVWDGRGESSLGKLAPEAGAVHQSNALVQSQARAASLDEYIRPEANVEHSRTETADTTHVGAVDTAQEILGQKIQGGEGASIAGELEAELTGGTIDLSNNVSASFTGEVSGGGSGLLGDISTSGSTTVEAETTQSLSWVLPELDLALQGAGCYVQIGSCDAEGSYSSSVTETTSTRSPFTLDDARAEYIVVDDSTITATSDYSITLSGSAQDAARAVNLVNAAGSVVANAANIARLPALGPELDLRQVNTVVQRR